MKPHIWYTAKYSIGPWFCGFRSGTDYRCGYGKTPAEAYENFQKDMT